MPGIGNINNSAGVGYTEMTGLGLTSTAQNQVKLDAAVSDAMADDILAALQQFRKEGNFNPTSAEMEAKLSVVGVAANQSAINQAQDLLFGLQQTYQFTLQDAGGDEDWAVHTFCNLAEAANGTVSSTVTAESGALSVVAGKTISGVFGASVANHSDGVYDLLSSLIPDTFNTDTSLQLPAGFWGHGSLSASAMQTMITALQTKIAEMKSAAPSNSANAVGGDTLTAHQWLAREMGVETPHDSYSLKQWGEIAEKLQVNAAKKLSQLSLGNGGGIQQVNGQYFVNGQEMSLSQVNFCVRANQYQLIDQQIADQMDAIQRNNDKAKQIQAVLAAFKTYDSETIGVDQSATTNFATMMDSGNGGWGVVQHYLNTNFDVTGSTSPSYEDYSALMISGVDAQPLSDADITCISNGMSWIDDIWFPGSPHPSYPATWSASTMANTYHAQNTPDSIGNFVEGPIFPQGPGLAGNLGITPLPATAAQLNARLAILAPEFTPPDTLNWTSTDFANLHSALSHKKTLEENKQVAFNIGTTNQSIMATQINEFFAILKAADPTFYSAHVTDTDGGPPYSFVGSITNTEFGSLKTNFGTYASSNSTDNQVAQQRLEALNNTRQSILTGMSAFTQTQSQLTSRIGGNL
jgi:hypothetical protein